MPVILNLDGSDTHLKLKTRYPVFPFVLNVCKIRQMTFYRSGSVCMPGHQAIPSYLTALVHSAPPVLTVLIRAIYSFYINLLPPFTAKTL